MITEKNIRDMANKLPDILAKHDDFVGSGVIDKENNGDGIAVAVYVAKPRDVLSQAFLEAVPKYLDVFSDDGAERVSYPVRIVNVGEFVI